MGGGLWLDSVEDEVQECGRKHVPDFVHFSLFVRCAMTGLKRASEAEVLGMYDLLECAREAFDDQPFGTPVAEVDAIFFEFAGYAREDFPSALVWLRVESSGVVVPCRLLRWFQRELMLLRERAVRRCAEIPFATTSI